MATNPGYDVFVSYAHADNEVPQNASTKSGWVTTLAENLNIGPNVRKKNLFIDHQLKPGDEFSDDLIAKVENSKLLLLLLSQNYIDSSWCGKELEHFIKARANDPDKPVDVFVVELFPYEKFTGVPTNLQNVRKRLIHAKFWHQPADTGSPVLSGYPTPRESGPEGEVHYWRAVSELRNAIDSRLRSQVTPQTLAIPKSPEISGSAPAVKTGMPHLATVLLADVTEDLESQRNAVKAAFEPEGITVLPDGDYVGLTPQEFGAAIAEDFKRSELFIQLLSTTAGRKGKGFTAPLPQLQFQRALEVRQPIIQWCEQLPAPGQITDPAHAQLFNTEFLRATNLATFKTEVISRLRTEKEKKDRREKAAVSSSTTRPFPGAGRKLVFVDDLASQPELNQKLRTIIEQENCDIRSLPPGAPLGNNGVDIKELLKPCRAGMTIYTDRDKFVTAYNRLVFFLNQIAEADLPLARWGVYLHEGDVRSVFGIQSADVVPVYEQGLIEFLRGL